MPCLYYLRDAIQYVDYVAVMVFINSIVTLEAVEVVRLSALLTREIDKVTSLIKQNIR